MAAVASEAVSCGSSAGAVGVSSGRYSAPLKPQPDRTSASRNVANAVQRRGAAAREGNRVRIAGAERRCANTPASVPLRHRVAGDGAGFVSDKLEIIAYPLIERPMKLRRAARAREWMDRTVDHFANRCLPLLIANQTGWDVLCPVEFRARWNGKPAKEGVEIRFPGEKSELVSAHFGSGVLTFTLGYLFRTSKGHNLWCKGLANTAKDAIAPLEGIIETDWAPYTFTMNWRFTRKRTWVTFEKDEPVCRLVPIPRHYAETFDAVVRPLSDDPELAKEHIQWSRSRGNFNQELEVDRFRRPAEKWQGHYMRGSHLDGRRFSDHRIKVLMSEFREPGDDD